MTHALAAAAAVAGMAAPASAQIRNLSQDWLFHRGDVAGGERPRLDDLRWRKVVVPHDWGIMDRPDGSPPFDPKAVAGQDSGYLPGGKGWYRRHLTLSAAEAACMARLKFEAVYMDADIWLNGEHLGRHRYGYTAFAFDLTGKLRAGRNVIAVRVNHEDPSSRWYAGSGIIRPVTLELSSRVHLDPDSIFVATPVATQQRGVVSVRAAIANRSNEPARVELISRVVSRAGKVVGEAREVRSVAPGGRDEGVQTLELARPSLWSPDAPNLYTLVQQVRVGGELADERRTRFGLRTITIDARQGLRINGAPVKLRGGNIHHDNYMIGAAGAPNADRRKVRLMKAAGYNAIRNAHNPASQATLNAADELGMLVIDEAFDAWTKSKRDRDYARFFAENWAQDIDSMVRSGRNHPSVLFWSIGNEIPEQGAPEGVATARQLAERIRQLDPTRPVTQAVSIDPPQSRAQSAVLDVAGYNYRAHLFEEEHKRLPEQVMYTSESVSKDAFSYWRTVETNPWVIGDFVWTAVDYLGESGIGWMGYSQDWQKLGPYPWHLAYCGEIDATGRKRPAAYYRQILWKTGIDPIAAFVRQPAGTEDLPDRFFFPIKPPHLDWSLEDVHPSWSWAGQEKKPLEVVVYSEFPEVELTLNGKSLGRKAVGLATRYQALFTVPYEAGELVAIGYREGRPAGRWTLRTAGDAARADLSSDRRQLPADGEALAYVAIELKDAAGTPLYARAGDRRVRVRVSGAGTLAGIGNGDPRDAASFQSGERSTFHGRVFAAIRAGNKPGPIVIEVEADGLPSRQIRLNAVRP
ncbi:glycoside hydrolase family 2 TIM barrel-domain containing protein [Sphingomonas sp.]|uniref:glycoside hydrolase family 2 TIM barrel-domain containing protein n=1 Tax=Sphingomonas sp. TaxID=28214 RepID=UPI0031DA47D1